MAKITETPIFKDNRIPTYPEIRIVDRVDDVYHSLQISTIVRLPSSAGWQRVLVSVSYQAAKNSEPISATFGDLTSYKEVCFKKFTIAVYEYMFGLGGTTKLVYNDGTPLFPLDQDQRSEQERLTEIIESKLPKEKKK